MTTLKNLKGTAIQFLDADPVLAGVVWASAGNINTARNGGGFAGLNTAALIFAGPIM